MLCCCMKGLSFGLGYYQSRVPGLVLLRNGQYINGFYNFISKNTESRSQFHEGRNSKGDANSNFNVKDQHKYKRST